MPKTTKRVEASDLNRNFWVIDSGISYLLKFLFDENGPVISSTKGIIKELSELWENIIYLWSSIYIIYGLKYHPLHLEVMYMPNSNSFPDRKFDDFSETNIDY